MSQDIDTLVQSLSSAADRFLQQHDHPPISGATIDAWGRLEMSEPPPNQRYSPRRQIDLLEASHRRAAKEGLCRACAHMLEVNVVDPEGRDRVAILVSVETSAGLALDVFLPRLRDDRSHCGGLDHDSTFSNPRPPRIFLTADNDSSPELASHSACDVDSADLPSTTESRPENQAPEREPHSDRSEKHTSRNPAEVQTRLLAAIVRGDLPAMEAALRQGARLGESLLGQTPVEMALRAEADDALDWLLAHGAPLPEIRLGWWRELGKPGKHLLRILARHGLRAPLWYKALGSLPRIPSLSLPGRR